MKFAIWNPAEVARTQRAERMPTEIKAGPRQHLDQGESDEHRPDDDAALQQAPGRPCREGVVSLWARHKRVRLVSNIVMSPLWVTGAVPFLKMVVLRP
jgi:hypothetical protein